MKIRLGNVLLTSVAVGFGLVTLLGYFVPALQSVWVQLLAWAGLLAAVAVLIGALSLARIHVRKISTQAAGWPYSLFTLAGFLAALAAGLAGALPGQTGGATTNTAMRFLFQHVIGATSAALAALLVFILVFAGYRLLRRPPTLLTLVFLAAALVALVGMAPALAGVPADAAAGLRDVWAWLAQVPAVAGARGLMLGIALGIIATGLRLLLAIDRPYGD
ncbi:MAG: hypothetical protein KA764_00465 [Anaerolineales bacterium]|nr:hypothetical protein [Anaerolineales bacterium]